MKISQICLINGNPEKIFDINNLHKILENFFLCKIHTAKLLL